MTDKVKIKIENAYEDGHESEHEVEVDPPGIGDSVDDWWDDVVLAETGDGHGIGNDLGYCYTATVLEADDPRISVGESREWCGR